MPKQPFGTTITTIDAGGVSYLSSHSNEGKNGENDQSVEAPIENTSECDSGFALQAIPSPARPRSPIEVGKICRASQCDVLTRWLYLVV